jgi:hypothetical protein
MIWTARCGGSEAPEPVFAGIVAVPVIWNCVEVSERTVRVKDVNCGPTAEFRVPSPFVVQSCACAHL